MRRRLVLRSRRSRPMSELVVGDSGGAHLFLIVGSHPATSAVELEEDQVEHLARVLTTWQDERAAQRSGVFRPERSEQRRAV